MAKVRDLRRKEKFVMDDEYLNGYAKICGIYATGVYADLCRHADKSQKCFPSIARMADRLGIGRDSVIKGITNLKNQRIIEVDQTRTKQGTWRTNEYVLLDKTEWLKKPQKSESDSVTKSATPTRNQVGHSDSTKSATPTLRKHSIKDLLSKDNKEPTAPKDNRNPDIEKLLDAYEKCLGVRPKPIEAKNGFDLNRGAAQRLIKRFGVDGVVAMVQKVSSAQTAQFFPSNRIMTNPLDLENNLAWYKVYFSKNTGSRPSVANIPNADE